MSLSIGKYKVDFQNFATNSLPWFRRFQWLNDYVFSIIAPIQTINDDFYQIMFDVDDYLSYTSQHLAMEELLNDKYDVDLRRIFITENNITGQVIDIYTEPETDPSPTTIYTQGEVNPAPISMYAQIDFPLTDTDFTIHMPISVVYNSDILDKLIKSYIDNRTFNVVTF